MTLPNTGFSEAASSTTRPEAWTSSDSSGLSQPPDPIHGRWWALNLPQPPHLNPLLTRSGHGAAYDPVGDRLLIHGGIHYYSLGDVWQLPLGDSMPWTQLIPAGAPPPPRTAHAMTYDPARSRLVFFGGFTLGGPNPGPLGDVWALSVDNQPQWMQMFPGGTPPSPRWSMACAYDPIRDRMVIFGGYDGVRFLNELWVLWLGGTSRWEQLSPQGPGPGPRNSLAAIYDPVRDRLVVHGGWTGSSYSREVWALSFSSTLEWAQLASVGPAPSPRREHAAVYDPLADRLVIYGGFSAGYLRDVWALELGGDPVWSQLPGQGEGPGARAAHSAIYDVARSRMMVFGGYGADLEYKNDTWALPLPSGESWADARSIQPQRPAPRGDHVAVLDPDAREMTVFGGTGYGPINDTWRMPLDEPHAWSEVLGPRPPDREGGTAILDPIGRRTILAGGRTTGGTHWNDLWQLPSGPGHAWTVLPAFGVSSPRAHHGAIYDPPRHRMLVLGGRPQVASLDVEALSLSATPTWTVIHPAGAAPEGRLAHLCVYDPVRDRVLIYGGLRYDQVTSLSDLWELRLSGTPSWNQLAPVGGPPTAARNMGAAYDAVRDRIVVFGGYRDGVGFTNELWELGLANPPAWIQLSPTGPAPTSRNSLTMLYDPRYDRMVVFGGWDGYAYNSETHSLNWGTPDPTPVELALVSASAEPGKVRLQWSAAAPGLTAAVERRTEDSPWTWLAEAVADGSGLIAFEDRDVRPGTRYGYRLLLREPEGERAAGETWVEVPAAAFALRGIQPNPVVERLQVSFALDRAGDLRLEVLDLAGRRRMERGLAGLPAGEASATFEEAGRLAPGLYWLRLTHAGRTRTARFCVVR